MGYAIDGRSKCHDAQCKEMIHAKMLRIGKRAPAVKGHSARVQWFHAECIFNSFGRMSGSTKTITSLADVERLALRVLERDRGRGRAPPRLLVIDRLAFGAFDVADARLLVPNIARAYLARTSAWRTRAF